MALAEAIREAMSAVMDGEASEMDLARVLRAVDEDPEARRYWQRLHQSRAGLKGGLPVDDIDVSQAVRTQLDSARPRRLAPLTSLAVAASVTLAVVFGGQLVEQADVASPVNQLPGMVMPVRGAAPVQASFGATPTAPTRQQAVSGNPNAVAQGIYEQLAKERLRRYGEQHAQETSPYQTSVLLPLARVPDLDP